MTAFGGALPLARRMIVERQRWLSEEEFVELLGLCQFLPGGNIINLSVALGMRFRGVRGALAAVIGLVGPPTILLIGVGAIYQRLTGIAAIRGALNGLSAAAAGLFVLLVINLLRTLIRSRPVVTVPVAAVSCAAVLSGLLSIPLALLALGPVSIAFAWFRRK